MSGAARHSQRRNRCEPLKAHHGMLVGCCLAAWQVGLLVGWLDCWLVSWIAGWLVAVLVGWLDCLLVGWIAGQLVGLLVGSLTCFCFSRRMCLAVICEAYNSSVVSVSFYIFVDVRCLFPILFGWVVCRLVETLCCLCS